MRANKNSNEVKLEQFWISLLVRRTLGIERLKTVHIEITGLVYSWTRDSFFKELLLSEFMQRCVKFAVSLDGHIHFDPLQPTSRISFAISLKVLYDIWPRPILQISLPPSLPVDTEERSGFPVSPLLSRYLPPLPPPDKMSLDEIYVINLERRPERKNKMVATSGILNLDVKFVRAVDGR